MEWIRLGCEPQTRMAIIRMGRKSRETSERISAQSRALLLGVSLPALLAQSALVCNTGTLTGFGWALLASLAGCLFTTLINWSALIQTFIPEQTTWKRALLAGAFLAAAMFVQGLALQTPGWTPLCSLSIAFIPWGRLMWRAVLLSEPFHDARVRLSAMILSVAAVVFLYPDLGTVFSQSQVSIAPAQSWPIFSQLSQPLPRSLSFIAALLFAAASSLQTAQQRSISSLTFWAIPAAVAAIILSCSGWIALQIFPAHTPVIGLLQNLPTHRLAATSPAFLFGIVMLALRPQIHVKNSLRIGRELNIWWQLLGLGIGCALSLVLLDSVQVEISDVVLFVLLSLGQFIGLRLQQNLVKFAPLLTAVPNPFRDKPQISNPQNS